MNIFCQPTTSVARFRALEGRLPRTAASLVIGLVFATSAWGVGPGVLQSRNAQGPLALVEIDQQHYVESAIGRQALPVPEGTAMTSFVGSDTYWMAAGVADRQALVVVADGPQGVTALPVPATTGTVVLTPMLAASSRGTHQLIWLEGNRYDGLAVRASQWQDGGWSTVEEVSPTGPGTQIALSATRIGDGSILATWAQFDGEDDEIVYSRWSDGRWTAPAPVAEGNAVPDITPSILAAPDGAWLVWSRYDGNDYRLNLARWTGSAWTAPRVIGGPGTHFPTLIDDAGRALLVYKNAVPRVWGVLELGAEGQVLRQAATAKRSSELRPEIRRASDDSLALRWPARGAKGLSAVQWQPATSGDQTEP